MSGGELANALVNICVALVVILMLYALVTVFFVEINPAAVLVAIIVVFAGLIWFRREVSFSK
ncbi:hypothetical protein E2P61_01900 [Candidatus Bathyarchaeota archaeon]|nr:hypothetical protein E2P61_01900 [Candidatus Bathyarchaeota archaeon]